MSYDLMVFEPDKAPKNRGDFMIWYGQQTEWGEPHGYNDPSVTTPLLLAWYLDMQSEFPTMNGSDARVHDDDSAYWDNPKLTEYSIGQSVIYIGFAWSQAEDAYRQVRRLAEKHGVGFFDVSADGGEIWVPSKPEKGFWSRLLGR
jgi:hypothetical protein